MYNLEVAETRGIKCVNGTICFKMVMKKVKVQCVLKMVNCFKHIEINLRGALQNIYCKMWLTIKHIRL